MHDILNEVFVEIYRPPVNFTLREATEKWIEELEDSVKMWKYVLEKDPEWGTKITFIDAVNNV